MDLQVQEIENEKLEKQKTDLQKQIESFSEKVVLLEKHERKYNIYVATMTCFTITEYLCRNVPRICYTYRICVYLELI
jgi:hypothetical protein